LSIKIQHFTFRTGLIAICFLSGAFLFSCKKNSLLTNSSAKLTFSQNAVEFDTVFTTVGSTVQAFLVHNNHNQPIQIASVKLVGNYLSPFKINLDGTPGTSFSNVTIPANDSIYVFVTVTLNPNNQNNPLVIEDSLQFITNGNTQYVYLQAYGQDAYFYKPNVFPSNGPAYSFATCNDVWKNDKPHVIFGYLAVNSGCKLTMEPGTKVYLHNNAVLYISQGGTLNVIGKHDSEVVFQGDRLEPEYQTVPGQWGEIWLSPGSINNNITWAVIKNGTIGVEADTLGNSSPTLTIDHTIIKSMSQFGLLGQGSYIIGNTDLIADCQYFCVDLAIGGSYSFDQCTFANYWSYGQRQTALLNINNWYQDVNGNNQSRPITKAFFGNCIIYGSQQEEVALDSAQGGAFNYYFEICDLATQHNTSNSFHYSSSTFVNQNPGFNNPSVDNYNIPTGLPIDGAGNDSIGYNLKYVTDLNGATRPSSPYDLGAYIAQ
jgi:hypothetical protein